MVVAQHGAALSNIAFMVDPDDEAAAADTHLGRGSSSSSGTATTTSKEEHVNKKPRHCRKQVLLLTSML